MRQLYKVHLKQQTLASDEYTTVEPARIFRGVDKDKHRKGGEFVTPKMIILSKPIPKLIFFR